MRALRGDADALLALAVSVLAISTAALVALARSGFCLHRFVFMLAGQGSTDMLAMSDMTADATCPIVAAAALGSGLLTGVVALLLARRQQSPLTLARAAARFIARVSFARLAGSLACAAAVPLALIVFLEAGPSELGAAAFFAILSLAAGVAACGLAGLSAVVLAFARRLVIALEAVLRRLGIASAPYWYCARETVLASGITLARRHPTRGPPALR